MDGARSLRSGRRAATDLAPLTSLRFGAAMLVFFAHWNVTVGRVPTMVGAAGVEFFFVLSGFILTHVYHADFDGRFTWAAARAFWSARFARLYPLHILTLAGSAAFGINIVRPEFFRIALGAQLLLVQSWLPIGNIPYAFNGPAWTISDEAFFYAIFPVALVGLSRSASRLSI